MLSILCVRLTIQVKVGIPESFKVGWYAPKKTGSSHLKSMANYRQALQHLNEVCPSLSKYMEKNLLL